MKNDFFEIKCAINRGERLTIKMPMSVHSEFQLAVSSTTTEAMVTLTELFAEFSELNYVKRQTFQALVEKRVNQISSLMDMINLLKATRLCNVFFGN